MQPVKWLILLLLKDAQMLKLSPKNKTSENTMPSCIPYSPSSALIFLSSLSIYFLPLLSPSPPSLNPSSSHLQGSHPSFVLLPPPPLHLHMSLSVFCQHLQGEAVPSTSHPVLLSAASQLCIFILCICIPFSLFLPSTCREAVLLFLLQSFHLHPLSVWHFPFLSHRPISAVHPFL